MQGRKATRIVKRKREKRVMFRRILWEAPEERSRHISAECSLTEVHYELIL